MRLREKYRLIFAQTLTGQEVLTDLLVRLHYFDEITNERKWRFWRDKNEEIVLQNFAKRILKILGVYEGRQAQDITQALLRIPVGDEAQEK